MSPLSVVLSPLWAVRHPTVTNIQTREEEEGEEEEEEEFSTTARRTELLTRGAQNLEPYRVCV